MNDLESRLRDDLTRESLRADVPVDLGGVLEAGHRGLRRRAIGRASAGTAFVLVAVLGGYGLSTLDRAAIEPAVTPTVTAGTSTVLAVEGVTEVRPESPDDYQSVEVRANANGSFTFTPSVDGGPGDPVTAMPASGAAHWLGDLGNGYSAGLLKGDVSWYDVTRPYSSEGGHGVVGDSARIPGTGWTAFVGRHDVVADVNSMTGVIWATGDGVIHSSRHEVVPSQVLSFPRNDNTLTVYHEPDLDTFGLVEADGQRGSMWPSQATDELLISMGRGIDDTDPDARWLLAGVLPSGSTFPAGAAGGTRAFELQLTRLAGIDGEVFVGIAAGTPPIDLTYRDAAGEWHTINP